MSKRRGKDSGWRKLVIGSANWAWRLGRQGIVVRDPQGHSTTVTLETLLGWTATEVERGSYKRYLHVTPGRVTDFIVRRGSA